jgi:chaperonin cofactor prefoldin
MEDITEKIQELEEIFKSLEHKAEILLKQMEKIDDRLDSTELLWESLLDLSTTAAKRGGKNG